MMEKNSNNHHIEPGLDIVPCEEVIPWNREETKCVHLADGINLLALLVAFGQDAPSQVCQSCSWMVIDQDQEHKELWVCLQCGHRGCGRQERGCARWHHGFGCPSDHHVLAVATHSWATWCYRCDDYVSASDSPLLSNSVNLVRSKFGVFTPQQETRDSRQQVQSSGNPAGVKGLQNLGNTCFFNAVLQVLSQTHGLNRMLQLETRDKRVLRLVGNGHSNEDVDITLGPAEALTLSLTSFLDKMQQPVEQEQWRSRKYSILTPRLLLEQVCHKSPRFSGGHQQDSHELLRVLLDGVRCEEIDRRRRSMPEHLTDDQMWSYNSQLKNTLVDQLFGGSLLSTVICHSCWQGRRVLEPFLSLSLPLPAKNKAPARPVKWRVRFNKHYRHAPSEENDGDKVADLEHASEVTTTAEAPVEQAWASRSLRTLAGARYQSLDKECSVNSCLDLFTAPELLAGANKYSCDNCTARQRPPAMESPPCPDGAVAKPETTVYTVARKQLLIFAPPAVLTLHVNRFSALQGGHRLVKVQQHVRMPLTLDLAPFCSSECIGVGAEQRQVLYNLYGVIEHSGYFGGGHYTAYVKVRPGRPESVDNFLLRSPIKLSVAQEQELKKRLDSADDVEESLLPAPESVPESNQKGTWYHVSDSSVKQVHEEDVLKCQAFLFFYERIV